MNSVSALQRLPTNHAETTLTFYWQGQPITAQLTDTLASALLAAGIHSTQQNTVSSQPRAPFCMMGSCFECLVDVDGVIVQACMTPVKADMQVKPPQKIDPL